MRLTVRELKKIIQEWPEVDREGEPTEVWVQTIEGISSAAKEVRHLNKRVTNEGLATYDMVISALTY